MGNIGGKSSRDRLARLALKAALWLGAALFMAPVALIFITALKPEAEIVHFGGLLPRAWTLANFHYVLNNSEEAPVFRWLANSFFISSMVTLLVLAVDSLAAFGLARLDLPGKKWVFGIILGAMMIPGQILLVPVYLILNRLGWLDTPLALIVPAGAGAFGVFLLRQYYLGIPRELEDAAAIDGCSRLGIYWHIALPLSRPILTVLGIFVFIGSWNDFMGPLVFLDSVDKYTLPVGIALFQSSYVSEYGITLAACVICMLPVIAAFLVFQKHIIKGISLTGMKE